MNDFTIIYVSVKGSPVDVWHPIKSIRVSDDCYRIAESNPDPEHWCWQFDLGDVVRCKNHAFAEGEIGLTAYAKCKE